jgi:hypothetical protein
MDMQGDLRAIATARRVRDRHAKQLEGKSDEEIIEFFRQAREELRESAGDRETVRHGDG